MFKKCLQNLFFSLQTIIYYKIQVFPFIYKTPFVRRFYLKYLKSSNLIKTIKLEIRCLPNTYKNTY